ncbi:MAG: AI-2E family transporter [Thermomicrobia bacterium]|nr:AI-2E family transporter [Thermomicrobia bacterium]
MSTSQEPAPNGSPPQTTLTVGRVMLFTAAALFVIFIANLLLKVTDLLFLLLIGILLATAIDPLARRLRKVGLNRPASILSVYLLIFAVFGGLIAFIIPPIVTQGTDFVTNLPRVADHLEVRYGSSNQTWIREAAHNGAVKLRQLSDNPPDISGVLKSQAVNVVSSLFGTLLSIVTVILISFYWLTERTLIRRALLGFVPMPQRSRVNDIWTHIETKLGQWFRAQLILCGIIGASCAIGYGLLGLQYWPLLALIAGAAEIIPILLVPRIQGDAVGLSPLTVILAILAGTTLAGPIGGILAVPISAIIHVLVQDLIIARETLDEDDIDRILAVADAAQERGENPAETAFRHLRRLHAIRRAHREATRVDTLILEAESDPTVQITQDELASRQND